MTYTCTFICLCNLQANLWCTSSRARKVVISLTLGALTAEVINVVCYFLAGTNIIRVILAIVLLLLIIPVAVLVINVVVAIQVRRAAIHSAANLGVFPHHQSTSAVPTIMLITTSLIYALINIITGIIYVIYKWVNVMNSSFSIKTKAVVNVCYYVVLTVYRLVFAYNFFVYLITGKLFRSDLRKLLCRCLHSSSSAPAPAIALAHAHGALAPAVIAADDDVDDDEEEVARRDVGADTAVRNLLQ